MSERITAKGAFSNLMISRALGREINKLHNGSFKVILRLNIYPYLVKFKGICQLTLSNRSNLDPLRCPNLHLNCQLNPQTELNNSEKECTEKTIGNRPRYILKADDINSNNSCELNAHYVNIRNGGKSDGCNFRN